MIARKILARKPYAPEIRKIEHKPELIREAYAKPSKQAYKPMTAEQRDAANLRRVKRMLGIKNN